MPWRRLALALALPATVGDRLHRDVPASVADQFVVAGSSLIFHIALARWLGASGYGTFVVWQAAILILGGVQVALVLDPMSVLVGGHKATERAQYVKTIVRYQRVLSLALCPACLAVAAVAYSGSLPSNAWLSLLALPAILAQAFYRRAAYAVGAPDRALEQGIAFAVVLLAGVYGFRAFEILDVATAFAALALAATVSAVVGAVRLTSASSPGSTSPATLRSIHASHWRLGKWGLAETLVHTMGTTVYAPLIAYFASLADAGAFRAIQILFLPLGHGLVALTLLLLPMLSELRSGLGMARMRQAAKRIVLGLAVIAFAYTALVGAIAPWLVGALYGAGAYGEVLWMAPWLAAAAAFAALSSVFSMVFRAALQPNWVFWTSAARSLSTLSLGLGLALWLGFAGLVVGWAISAAAATSVALWLFVYRWPHSGFDNASAVGGGTQ